MDRHVESSANLFPLSLFQENESSTVLNLHCFLVVLVDPNLVKKIDEVQFEFLYYPYMNEKEQRKQTHAAGDSWHGNESLAALLMPCLHRRRRRRHHRRRHPRRRRRPPHRGFLHPLASRDSPSNRATEAGRPSGREAQNSSVVYFARVPAQGFLEPFFLTVSGGNRGGRGKRGERTSVDATWAAIVTNNRSR